jgi:hypothetical protein
MLQNESHQGVEHVRKSSAVSVTDPVEGVKRQDMRLNVKIVGLGSMIK